jgi:sulfatase maturation enzyme AslB (radical SAM superfamily)
MQQVLSRWFNLFGINNEIIFKLYKDRSIRKVIKNVFKGMSIFGIRLPFVTGAPLSVVWNFTKKCNLKCSHCFADANYNKKSENELDTEEAKRVIDILAANDVVTVNFCGGEPLIREDVFEIMNYTKNRGI